MPDEVFLSHSSADRPFAKRLAATLRRHRVPVWYSDTNIQGAQQWHDEIGAALVRCDWFVVALSPNAVKSKWVKRELLFALQQDRFDGRIAPVIYQPCSHMQLSWTLSQIQMIDFSDDFDRGCRDLLRIRGLGFVPAPTPDA